MLRHYICQSFAQAVNLSAEEIFEKDLTLSEIIAISDKLQNSIDLMESFARVANSLKKEYGIQVRLPALSLDTAISEVLEIFLEEAAITSAA
ncbi:MAG: hypothetical protein MH252_02010 [Thermosynechococcaceae cyanobacterium MS004]|nr:hypothetical protein [Thermosynechococcaceae cyanobacterium MS004]